MTTPLRDTTAKKAPFPLHEVGPALERFRRVANPRQKAVLFRVLTLVLSRLTENLATVAVLDLLNKKVAFSASDGFAPDQHPRDTTKPSCKQHLSLPLHELGPALERYRRTANVYQRVRLYRVLKTFMNRLTEDLARFAEALYQFGE